jgi:transcriptional regulator with XRE-family HTH domain
MYTYREPSFERVRRIRLLRLKYLNDSRCKDENFAKTVGVDTSTLKRIESGREEIAFDKASKILGVTIEYLMSEIIMAEDMFAEPIVHRPQIGSMMHALRIQRAEKDRKKFTLKAVAAALGKISSMELKRIEELGNSKYLQDEKFLKKVAELFGVPWDYLKALVETSFPRGKDKKEATSNVCDPVRYIKEGEKIKGLTVLRAGLTTEDMEALKRRIELEIDILRKKYPQK